jgi:hypothetical protein
MMVQRLELASRGYSRHNMKMTAAVSAKENAQSVTIQRSLITKIYARHVREGTATLTDLRGGIEHTGQPIR